jgi:hypothetical protein
MDIVVFVIMIVIMIMIMIIIIDVIACEAYGRNVSNVLGRSCATTLEFFEDRFSCRHFQIGGALFDL